VSGPGRRWPLRNTVDDEMTFAELLGVPDLDDAAALLLMENGHSTTKAADAYRARQVVDLERAKSDLERQAVDLERAKSNKAKGARAETLRADEAADFAWAHYKAQTGRKSKDRAATAAHKQFPKVPWQTIRNRLKIAR